MTEMVLAVRITADGAQLVSATRTGAASANNLKESLSAANNSAVQLKAGVDGAVAATTRMTGSASTARSALGQMAAAQDQVGQASRRAAQETERAAVTATKAMARQRIGMQQLGVQTGDFFTQIASGGNAFIAFAQQSQQAVGALQMMAAEGAATGGVMSRFANFMAGPWGIAIGVALPIVGMLASKLFETADAANVAEQATKGLADSQSSLAEYIVITTGKVREQITQLQILGQVRQQQGNINTLRAERNAQSRQLASDTFHAFVRRSPLGLPIRDSRDPLGRYETVDGWDQVGALNRRLLTDPRFTAEQYNDAFQAMAANNPRARSIAGRVEQSAINIANLNGEIRRGEALQRVVQGKGTPADRALLGLPAISAETSRARGGGRGRGDGEGRGAARLNEQDANWAESTEEAVRQINDRWGEQPRLIAQSEAATRELNRIIAEAQERLARRGIGAEEAAALRDRIGEAQAALSTVAQGVDRPWRDMIAASERQRDIQMLVLQGREREADVLQRVQRLEADGIDVTAERRAEIERIVELEDNINQLLDKRALVIDAYGASISDIRGSLEDLLAGGSLGDFGANMEKTFRRLQSRLTVERLFGDGLRQLEQRMRRETGFEGVVETLGQQTSTAGEHIADAGNAAREFAAGARDAAAVLGRINPSVGGDQLVGLSRDLGTSISSSIMNDLVQSGWLDESATNPIDVAGTRNEPSGRMTLSTMSPNDFMREAARVLVSPLREGLERLDRQLGTNIAGPLAGALEGGFAGRFMAGDVGMVLGAVQGSGRIKGKAGKRLDDAMGGAQQGFQIAQLGKMLGIKTSSTGGSIGGAIGAASGIPGLDIVGSIVGSVFGGLFKKTPKGTLSITADGATYAGSGKLRESLTSAGSAVNGTLASIAEQLGAEVGSFSGSIRQKGKKIYANGARVADLEAAASKVLSDALTGGALTGISGAVRKALGSSSDIDKAVKEALKVQQVEDMLGGIGAAMSKQFRAFETQAKERVRIAEQYGFDIVEIEKRNAEDRAKIADQVLTERVGALRDLLSDIRIGDLFEGTAADRRTALLAEIAKTTTDAEAGKDGAAATLADLQRRLIDTSRSAYGTAGTEYATDRANTISTAERIIAMENERVKAAQDAAIGTKAAVETNNALTSESNDLLARIAASIDQLTMTGGLPLSSTPIGIGRSVEL